MIARHEPHLDKTDVWSALAAPLATEAVAWRQDGRPVERDGRWYARFVAYVDANTVRERLDRVVPGEWDLTLDLLPALPARGDDDSQTCSFKARLQILGVIREDVGTGRDYKAAATDAFKRAAVRFGIAHELYQLDPNWVEVDGDGRWAKPLEEPQAAYARREQQGRDGVTGAPTRSARRAHAPAAESEDADAAPVASASITVVEPEFGGEAGHQMVGEESPDCPKCSGQMWDNRLTKRNPKAPDFKCRDRSCDGVIWPSREGSAPQRDGAAPAVPAAAKRPAAPKRAAAPAGRTDAALDASPLGASADDDLPF